MDAEVKFRKTPKWRKVFQSISKDISDGLYDTGALPSAEQLASTYDVHPSTVRRALGEMQLAGLVRIVNGRGAFVQEKPLLYRLGVGTFVRHIIDADQVPGGALLRSEVVAPTAKDRRLLALPPGDRVVSMTVIAAADDVPLVVATHRMSERRYGAFPEVFRKTGVMDHAWAELGFQMETPGRLFKARLPRPDEAAALRMSARSPIIEAEYVSFDSHGYPSKHSIAAFCTERVQLSAGDVDHISAGLDAEKDPGR